MRLTEHSASAMTRGVTDGVPRARDVEAQAEGAVCVDDASASQGGKDQAVHVQQTRTCV